MHSHRAIQIIRECVHEGRYALSGHFIQRMDERGLFWPDVQAVIDSPSDVQDEGQDSFGRPRWLLSGTTTDRCDVQLLCVLDADDEGNRVVFITIYWKA